MPRLSGSARNRPLPLPIREKGRTPANDLPESTSEITSEITVELPAELDRLRAHIRQLEGFSGGPDNSRRSVLPFGIDAIDSHLPGGGLVRGALHDVFADDAGVATAFCALLAGRLAQPSQEDDVTETKLANNSGTILWCERPWTLDAGALYGPALLTFGIDPAQLILVRARRDADVLWAMEEGLRCNRLAAVIGEIAGMSLTASRRLQLAAEESGVTALTLRPRTDKPAPSAAATRWRLDAVEHDDFTTTNETTDTAPPGLGAARWRAEMFRCRGGASASWMMEWNDETGDFSVAALVRNRPPVPSAAGLAG